MRARCCDYDHGAGGYQPWRTLGHEVAVHQHLNMTNRLYTVAAHVYRAPSTLRGGHRSTSMSAKMLKRTGEHEAKER